MKRLVALLLAGILLGGGICSGAAADAEVFSWDYSFRFHLNTGGFSFREKEHVQGYADLLEALELKGSLAWCPETNSMELSAEVLPVANPSAGVSFRMFGFPELLQVSSPVFGEETVWFMPARFMYFAQRTWEALQIPLPYLALLIPATTENAFQGMVYAWNEEAGTAGGNRSVSAESVERIAETWRKELEENFVLQTWVSALTNFLPDSEPVESALNELPDLLLAVSAGEDLAIELEEIGTEGRIFRCLNAEGITLFEEHREGQSYDCALTLPDTGTEYTPFFSFRKTDAEGTISLELQASWDRLPDTKARDGLAGTEESRPDSILRVQLGAEGIPVGLPADASFSGRISVEGYMLPNFGFLISGSTSAEGNITISVTPEDRADAGSVFICSGKAVPAVREKSLAYTEEELKTGYNLFGLNDESLHRLVSSIVRPFLSRMIDFLYELPVSSCQAIMDDLEEYGILQTLLK